MNEARWLTKGYRGVGVMVRVANAQLRTGSHRSDAQEREAEFDAIIVATF